MFNAILKSKVTNNQGIMKRSIYLLLVGMFLLCSCYEEPLTKGVITVYDQMETPLRGRGYAFTRRYGTRGYTN